DSAAQRPVQDFCGAALTGRLRARSLRWGCPLLLTDRRVTVELAAPRCSRLALGAPRSFSALCLVCSNAGAVCGRAGNLRAGDTAGLRWLCDESAGSEI